MQCKSTIGGNNGTAIGILPSCVAVDSSAYAVRTGRSHTAVEGRKLFVFSSRKYQV